MRVLMLVMFACGLAGCGLFDTPCDRVARSICTVPGESGSCRFLRDMRRGDENAQKMCERLEPAAEAYAADPTSLGRKAQWLVARAALATAGFVDDTRRKEPGPFGRAGEAAREAGEILDDAAERTRRKVEEAFGGAGR